MKKVGEHQIPSSKRDELVFIGLIDGLEQEYIHQVTIATIKRATVTCALPKFEKYFKNIQQNSCTTSNTQQKKKC